jgi:hypothetical protein
MLLHKSDPRFLAKGFCDGRSRLISLGHAFIIRFFEEIARQYRIKYEDFGGFTIDLVIAIISV